MICWTDRWTYLLYPPSRRKQGDRTLEDVITTPGNNPPAWQSRGDWLTWCQRVLEQSSVIVFSPEGRLVRMKKGSTLLDFVRMYYGSVGALSEAQRRSRHSGGKGGKDSRKRAASSAFAAAADQPRRKRSQSGMMLINGQTASSLDRELCTGDVITSL